MSEAQALPTTLSDAQGRARYTFLRKCGDVSLFLMLIPVHVIFIAGFIGWLTTNMEYWFFHIGLTGGGITALLAPIYWIAIVAIIRTRTGLAWNMLSVGAERGDINLLAIWMIYVGYMVVLLLQLQFTPWFFVTYLLGMIFLWGMERRFGAKVKERIHVEQDKYGRHWLELGRLSGWDILLFRIPHEHA